ncbi:MAG: porin [bacterium]|nr:porin [bacterium]
MKKMLRSMFAGAVLFAATSSAFAGETDVLLNKLVEKGFLNAAESQEVRTDTQNSIDAAKKAEAEAKAKESKDKADIKIGGYTQVRFEHFAKPNAKDQFRIKTVTLSIAGKVLDKVNYKAEIDPSKSPSGSIVNDAYMKFSHFDYANITIGQFKIPYSDEFLTSSSAIDTIERSLPVGSLAQERDMGLMVDANLFNKSVYYGLAIVNGSGANASEDNSGKDAVGKIVFTPVKGLSFGVNYMTGKEMEQKDTYSTTTADSKTGMFKKTSTQDPYSRTRSGALVKYVFEKFNVQGEYLTQKKDYEDDSKTDVTGNGYYVQAAYKIPLEGKMAIQPVVKYETYDPDKDIDSNTQKITTVGLNWFINDNTKLMVDYRARKDETVTTGSLNEVLAQIQIKI